MTLADVFARMRSQDLEDQWWVNLDGTTEPEPMALVEAAELVQIREPRQVLLLNAREMDGEDWIEVDLLGGGKLSPQEPDDAASVDSPAPVPVETPSNPEQLLEPEFIGYGGFWVRVGAYLIDFIVLFIPLVIITAVLRPLGPAGGVSVELMDNLVSMAVWWLYYAGLHSSKWQASVGKRAFGLKVVDESGQRISFARATGRYFAGFLSAILLGFGYLMVAFTRRKQGLHDFIAGTMVLRVG